MNNGAALLLRWILILGGIVLLSAFGACLLPVATMADWHQRLGLGEYPQAPITSYLARSTALMYGVHGVLMFYCGLTWPRYSSLAWLFGALHVVIGCSTFVIDCTSPMPRYWILIEGPPVAALGLLMIYLGKRAIQQDEIGSGMKP